MNEVDIEEESRVDMTETPEKVVAEEISSTEVKQILEIPTTEELIIVRKNRVKKPLEQDISGNISFILLSSYICLSS